MRRHLDAIWALLLISVSALMPSRSAAQEPDAPEPQAGVEGRLLLDPRVRTDRLWVRIFEARRPDLDPRRDKALARVPVDAEGRFRATGLSTGAVDVRLETSGDYLFPVLQADVPLSGGATRQLADIDLRGRVGCFVVRMQDPAGTAISEATLHAASSPRTFAPFVVPTDGGVAVLTLIGGERLRYWADVRGFHGRWIEDLSSDLTLTLRPVPILRLHVRALSPGTKLTLTPVRDGVGAEEPGTLEGRTGEEDVIEVEIERQGLYRLDVAERPQDRERSDSTAAARRRFRPVRDALLPRVIELRGPLTEVTVGWGPELRSAGVEGDTARLEGRLLLDPGVPTEHLRLWVAVASRRGRRVSRRVSPLALVAIDPAGCFRVSGLPAGTVDLALETPADYRFHVLARGLGLWPGVTIRLPAMDVRGSVHSCRVSVQDPEGRLIPGATVSAAKRKRGWHHRTFDASGGPVTLVSAADPPKLVADALGFRAEEIPFGAPEITLVLQRLPLVRLRFDSSFCAREGNWSNLRARLTRLGDQAARGEDSAAEPARDSDHFLDLEVESEGRYRLRLSSFEPEFGSSSPFLMPRIPVRPEVIDVRGPLTEVWVTRIETERR